MIHHFAKIVVDSQRPWVLQLEIKKNWSRHDILSHSIKRGYLTRDEAECCRTVYRNWANSLPKSVIPIDRTQYQWKDTVDRYAMKGI